MKPLASVKVVESSQVAVDEVTATGLGDDDGDAATVVAGGAVHGTSQLTGQFESTAAASDAELQS